VTEPLVEIEGVSKWFPLPRSLSQVLQRGPKRAIHAVDDVSLSIGENEAVGLIGESGSGKTTLGWLVARLHDPTAGKIRFAGEDITRLRGEKLRKWRRNVQIVFQDPVGSLDPRLKVWQIVGEPLRAQSKVSTAQVKATVAELLPTVGLPSDCLEQYPHEFSGGGRQRLSLARALSLHPRLIVLDEPTSALDVAVQAQILNRLVGLQREQRLSYLLITHNVSAVRYVADRVAVMYLGEIVEVGPAAPPDPLPDRWGDPDAGRPADRLPVRRPVPVRHPALPQRGAPPPVDPDEPGGADRRLPPGRGGRRDPARDAADDGGGAAPRRRGARVAGSVYDAYSVL
jgi:ABC-type glutathione transport system ATPase component